MRIIPAIDLKSGKCVRLYQGNFDKTTEYSSDPAEISRRFSDLDVRELHVVDLDGARTGTQQNQSIVAEIAAHSSLAIQLGGGIRTREDVARWLAAGVTRCVIGSVAISKPATVREWLLEFGADAIVLALDIKLSEFKVPLLTSQGWTKDSSVGLWDRIDTYRNAGARHILCTDVARDGAMTGPNFDLYSEIMRRYPDLQLQASGGVRDMSDLRQLRRLGIPAAITGRALLDGAISATEVTAFQQSA